MPRGREFNIARPFVAQATFRFESVIYSPGDPFPWRELGLTERKLYTLWARRRVWHGEPAQEAAAPAVDPLAGLLALAAIGAACQPPPATAKPARRARAGA